MRLRISTAGKRRLNRFMQLFLQGSRLLRKITTAQKSSLPIPSALSFPCPSFPPPFVPFPFPRGNSSPRFFFLYPPTFLPLLSPFPLPFPIRRPVAALLAAVRAAQIRLRSAHFVQNCTSGQTPRQTDRPPYCNSNDRPHLMLRIAMLPYSNYCRQQLIS